MGNAFGTRSEGPGLLEDKDVITTWLVSSAKVSWQPPGFGEENSGRDAELTDWIQKNPDEAQKLLIDELAAETKTTFAPDAVSPAWKRIKFTTAVPNELIAQGGYKMEKTPVFLKAIRTLPS